MSKRAGSLGSSIGSLKGSPEVSRVSAIVGSGVRAEVASGIPLGMGLELVSRGVSGSSLVLFSTSTMAVLAGLKFKILAS